MPRRLLAVNVVLASVSLLCAGFIVKQLTGSRAPAVSRARPPATTPAARAGARGRAPPAPGGRAAARRPAPARPPPPAPPAAGQPPVPGQPPGAGQPPASSPLPTPGVLSPSPRVFMPPPVAQPVQPGSPPAVQQPPPGLPTPGPFGRPSPSLGRRLPPLPIDPSAPQQPTPAPPN